ncbi:MAG TPA: diguanylate cyclase [Bordetella sp.]
MHLNLLRQQDGRRYSTYFCIFVLTFVLCLIGAHTRLSAIELSVFWPVNVIDAALFYRLRLVRNPWCHASAYAAMVAQDSLSQGWGIDALTINAANIVFIFVLGELLSRSTPVNQRRADITGFFHTVLACLAAAALCAVAGALAQQASGFAVARFDQALLSWFSEEFYTAMLCLPILLTLRGTFTVRLPAITWKNTLPLLSLVASLGLSTLVGPFAILVLPLPALTWCAVTYPLWLVQLITLCTGCLQLIMAAGHLHDVYSRWGETFIHEIAILRICIAATIFSPLLMAINAGTIRQLNRRLIRQASYDFLTNTLSRYGLTEALNQYGASHAYRNATVNIMLIDVDHFKSINDNFGHVCGDDVLKRIAAIINHAAPTPGLVGRIGGEEFVVVCFDYAPQTFYALADALRQTIADTPFDCGQQRVSITISIGIAHATEPGSDLESAVQRLFPRADENLYTAKRQGRNCTVQ